MKPAVNGEREREIEKVAEKKKKTLFTFFFKIWKQTNGTFKEKDTFLEILFLDFLTMKNIRCTHL